MWLVLCGWCCWCVVLLCGAAVSLCLVWVICGYVAVFLLRTLKVCGWQFPEAADRIDYFPSK